MTRTLYLELHARANTPTRTLTFTFTFAFTLTLTFTFDKTRIVLRESNTMFYCVNVCNAEMDSRKKARF